MPATTRALSDLTSTLQPKASDDAKHVFVSYVREDAERVDTLRAQAADWRIARQLGEYCDALEDELSRVADDDPRVQGARQWCSGRAITPRTWTR